MPSSDAMLLRNHRTRRPVASLRRGDVAGGDPERRPRPGFAGTVPRAPRLVKLGRRGASREPAIGPALRGFDCARDTALPPDPLALCGTQPRRIADALRKQVVHETSGSEFGVASMPFPGAYRSRLRGQSARAEVRPPLAKRELEIELTW